MREKILILILTVFLFSPAVSFPAESTDNTTNTNTPQAEQADKVLKTFEAAKSGQINIKKTAEQLSKEKEDLDKQKALLVASGSGTSAENQEVKKQLRLIAQQRQLIEAKEMAIDERIEATEKIVSILEQKIQIINNVDLPLSNIMRETKTMHRALREDLQEKASLEDQIPLIQMEIKAIEKEVIAQGILADLKKEEKDTIKESIKENELRLELARSEIDFINERIGFVAVQIEIEKNYLNVLWEKRLDTLKDQLFIPRPYSFDPIDVLIGIILLTGIYFMVLRKRKPDKDEPREEIGVSYVHLSVKFLKKVFLGSMIFSGVYFLISFVGYHQLMIALIYKLVLVTLIAFMLWSVQCMVKRAIQKIIFSREEGSKERIMMKTFLDMAGTVLGWALFCLGVYLVIEMLGVRKEALDFIVQASQKPFFALGKVNLSAWLVFKAIVILWLFIAGSNFLDGFLRHNVYKRMHLDESVQYTFSVTIKYLMLMLGVLIGLSALGVELGAITVFAGTIGIGIGFGLQDIAKNFISGIVMLVERPVKIGDYIEVNGLPGKVKAIKARSTIVDTFDNISVIIPNADFMTQNIVNWSYSDKITRLKLMVGVAYGTDPELVKITLLEASKSHPNVMKRPEPYVWFTEFGSSSLNFELYVWTADPVNRFTLKSQINFAINRLFKEKGIKVPFPQRDIHFVSSEVPLK